MSLYTALPDGIIARKPFVPHTLEHLIDHRVFPNPLPEVAYEKMLEEYASVEDVKVEEIRYLSDGLEVVGLVALPPELKENAHPLMIYNRGGSGEYGKLTVLNVIRSMVPFARKGYLVFASNYRGNGGGEGEEQFGGVEIADVLNLMAIGEAHPAFDGKNRFMLGHSRGGMMTSLAMKEGAKLNAAISIAGISDASKLKLAQRTVERIYKRPPTEEEAHREITARSSICWPEAITAPYLLLHGDNDADVDYRDSEAFYEAIKRVGGVADIEIFEKGNHALLRHWPQVLDRCFDWLERYRL